jgi:hypothetical protein
MSAGKPWTEHTNEGIPMETHLSGHHRDTVRKIFSEPTSHNVEWREVVSLLETVGTVTQEHNGKLKIEVGPETEVFTVPRDKDTDVQTLVDLRRMLKQAGFTPESAAADKSTRDHGDGQWGEPT